MAVSAPMPGSLIHHRPSAFGHLRADHHGRGPIGHAPPFAPAFPAFPASPHPPQPCAIATVCAHQCINHVLPSSSFPLHASLASSHTPPRILIPVPLLTAPKVQTDLARCRQRSTSRTTPSLPPSSAGCACTICLPPTSGMVLRRSRECPCLLAAVIRSLRRRYHEWQL